MIASLLVALFSLFTFSAPRTSHEVLYAGVGPRLSWYDVDVSSASMERRGSTVLPANIQYAWAAADQRHLYVAWSDMAAGSSGTHHGVTAFRIDARSGALARLGVDVSLPSRPIHLTVDARARTVFVAHNDPSGVSVIPLARDGSFGTDVSRRAFVVAGVYAHQVRVSPSDSVVYLVTRGVGPSESVAERPGAIQSFRSRFDVLSVMEPIAPAGGFGFQPRNLDFHPSRPWVYVALERQNVIEMFTTDRSGVLAQAPAFSTPTMDSATSLQTAGAIIVHPNGQHLYVANRAAGARDSAGTQLFTGGSNSIATFDIDRRTGAPTLVANEPTRGFSPRTMSLDASGRLLAVANQIPLSLWENRKLRFIPASVALFRIDARGRPVFARKYNVDTNARETLFWVGLVTLPALSP